MNEIALLVIVVDTDVRSCCIMWGDVYTGPCCWSNELFGVAREAKRDPNIQFKLNQTLEAESM